MHILLLRSAQVAAGSSSSWSFPSILINVIITIILWRSIMTMIHIISKHKKHKKPKRKASSTQYSEEREQRRRRLRGEE